jgi:hypothetical protein
MCSPPGHRSAQEILFSPRHLCARARSFDKAHESLKLKEKKQEKKMRRNVTRKKTIGAESRRVRREAMTARGDGGGRNAETLARSRRCDSKSNLKTHSFRLVRNFILVGFF